MITFTIHGEPASSRITYIYGLLDPLGACRYVGKSDAPHRRFERHIKVNRRTRHLGRYETEIDAARAYNAEARALGWPEEGLNPV